MQAPQITLGGGILPASAKNEINSEIIDDHVLISENSKFSMFLNKEAMSIIIRYNESGALIHSAVQAADENDTPMWKTFMQSGISIEYFAGTATTTTRADMYVKKPTKEVTRTDNGFYANINYDSLGISFVVVVELSDKGISVKIPNNLINENGISKLAAIYVFPFLGYTKLGEKEGYMFIPDGCGALISLENNNGQFSQPYVAQVYGDDYGIDTIYENTQLFDQSVSMYVAPKTVTAPVFGMVHTDEKIGFLGVVKSGACYAEICAYPNGAISQYNWITAKFVYRKTYYLPTSKENVIPAVQSEMNSYDANTEFLFVSDESADYNGLAKAYRSFLEENNMLSQNNEKISVRLDLFGGDLKKSLLSNDLIAVTTTSEAQEILESLKSKGIENILAVFTSYSDTGRFGNTDTDGFEVAKELGGEKGLSELTDYCNNNGIEFFVDVDPTNSISSSSYGSDLIAKNISNKVICLNTKRKIYSESYLYNPLTTAKSVSNQVEKGINFKLPGLYLSGLSNLYSDYNTKSSLSRLQSQMIYSQSCSSASQSLRLALSMPFDFLWKYTDSYFDFPVYSSNYKFVDKEIPFFAIALQGTMDLYSEYVNFNADAEEFYLKLIESGVAPSFLLTYSSSNKLIDTDSKDLYSTDYNSYVERIEKYYSDISELKEITGFSSIDEHFSEDSLSIVRYSNGATVYVNFTDEEIHTEYGVTIEAKDYCVVKP